ncbi:hemolysin D [Oceaniferula spumae]|uniref:Hemolysin D n=1 Tax=Oceaniferula spumae TaxID=2979115 RepID=A0AAT9FGQ2_9BACT
MTKINCKSNIYQSMSLDQLSNSNKNASSQPRGRRSLAWLLPAGLLIGFLLIMALLFGKRLIPAVEVKTAQVITLRQEADAVGQPVAKAEESPAVTKGSLLFQASGWVEPDPYITYVPTLMNGVIDQVKVLEGQQVKKGELLAIMIDDDASLDLQEAEKKIISHQGRIDAHCQGTHIIEAELEAAKKKITALKTGAAEAADNYQRLKKIPAGAVPQQQVVAARLTKEKQEALVAEAEAEIPRLKARLEQIEFERVAMTSQLGELQIARDRAQLTMDRTKITAPMDGIVLRLHAAPGKKRMLNMDDPESAVIFELYDPENLQARIDVPLTEAAGIQVGQIVELTSDLLPDMTFNGTVTRITGEADLQRNTLQAKVSIKNPDIRLRPEMLVRGKFYSTGRTGKPSTVSKPSDAGRLALYVPEAALIDDNSVWVVDSENIARLRKIQLGKDARDNHRRVLDGLRSGENVILPPHDKLEDGTRVVVTNTK